MIGRIVHLRVVTKTLVEAIKEFRKKPIIIVEDIDSVKGNLYLFLLFFSFYYSYYSYY